MPTSIDLWSLHNQLEQSNVLLCFNGPLSQSIIEQLGVAIKRYLHEERLSDEKLYDVFAVYIEQTQNIRNYAKHKAEAGWNGARLDTATVAIGKLDANYLVTAGNPVARADVAGLAAQIDGLAGLDAEALKSRYKEQRRHARTLDTATAGLGLIDMARKASQPLEYQIREIDSETAFFHLIAVI
ncbi:MAG: SiaB family protein kinase [Janthinobacterium lividum]